MMLDQNPYTPPRTDSAADTAPAGDDAIDHSQVARRCTFSVAVCAFAIGIAARLARPHFSGPVHYESLVALACLVILCLGALACFWRFPRAVAVRSLQIALLVLWAAFTAGWSLIHGSLWGDLLAVNAICWLASSVIGSLALLTLRKRERPAQNHA